MAVATFSKLAVESLKGKYRNEIQQAITNLHPYLVERPVGIGEHSELVEEIEKQLEKISHAEDMLSALDTVVAELELEEKTPTQA